MSYSDGWVPYAMVKWCRSGGVTGIIYVTQKDDKFAFARSCGCCVVEACMRTHLNEISYVIVVDGSVKDYIPTYERTILTYTHSVGVVNHVPVATLKITYYIVVFGVLILMETTLYENVKEASRDADVNDVNQWCNPEITLSITDYDFNTLCRNSPEIDDNDPNTQPHIIIANAAYGLIETTLKLIPRVVKIVVTSIDDTTVTTTLYPNNE